MTPLHWLTAILLTILIPLGESLRHDEHHPPRRRRK